MQQKRRQISGEVSESKRDKRDSTIEDSDSETSNMGDDFVTNMENALTNDRVAGLLVNLFKISIQETTENINKRLDNIEETATERDDRITTLETKVDEFEQKSKENNCIVTGLQQDQTSKESVMTILNDRLKTDLRPEDILYTLRLGKVENRTVQIRTRVVFSTKEIRSKIFKMKKELKGSGIWISDELTPYRDRLAYLARQAVKQNKALQTWTNEGKVFLKIDNVDQR